MQLHWVTSNEVTGNMQSRLALIATRLSFRPIPRGLTIPAAVTATREAGIFPFKSSNVGIFAPFPAAILIAFQIQSPYTVSPKGENSSSEVRQLSLRRCSGAI